MVRSLRRLYTFVWCHCCDVGSSQCSIQSLTHCQMRWPPQTFAKPWLSAVISDIPTAPQPFWTTIQRWLWMESAWYDCRLFCPASKAVCFDLTNFLISSRACSSHFWRSLQAFSCALRTGMFSSWHYHPFGVTAISSFLASLFESTGSKSLSARSLGGLSSDTSDS